MSLTAELSLSSSSYKFFFKKVLFMCICVRLCENMPSVAFGGQKRASGPHGDRVADGCESQDMGAGDEVGSSGRVAGALNCLTITPASSVMNYYL